MRRWLQSTRVRYYRTPGAEGAPAGRRTGAEAYGLTSAQPSVTAFEDLTYVVDVSDRSVDGVAQGLLDAADPVSVPAAASVAVPTLVDEVWAVGVTYEISEQAREAESGMPQMYPDVYAADRPGVCFKPTRVRVVAPGEATGSARTPSGTSPTSASSSTGETVGYTVGNDVSSRPLNSEPAVPPAGEGVRPLLCVGFLRRDPRRRRHHRPHDVDDGRTRWRDGLPR